MVSGFGFRVSGFGFRVSGFGFRVSGFGFIKRLNTKKVFSNAITLPPLSLLFPDLGFGFWVLGL